MPETHDILDQNEIASLGASLRAIDQKILKKGNKSGTTRIWFQGAEPYFDVFFELNDDEIIWFQFTLRGKSLSWNRKTPVFQTGNTNELNIDDVSFYAASKTMEPDTKSDLAFINLVKSIFETRTEESVFAQVLVFFN